MNAQSKAKEQKLLKTLTPNLLSADSMLKQCLGGSLLLILMHLHVPSPFSFQQDRKLSTICMSTSHRWKSIYYKK
jgi:hypothetical protein